ncbi:hypothetical protein BG004_000706 [Podila humilis]|nr:hypothetical protein BG004_000706 [Podila humilis]
MASPSAKCLRTTLWLCRQPIHHNHHHIRKQDPRLVGILQPAHGRAIPPLTTSRSFHSSVQANHPASTVTQTLPALDVASTSAKRGTKNAPKLPWTSEVDARMIALRVEEKKRWNEIGKTLDREPATCMTRFESTLNPSLKGFWTEERAATLEKLVESGKSWSEIGQAMGCHRLACMEKWRHLSNPVGPQSHDLLPVIGSNLTTDAKKLRSQSEKASKKQGQGYPDHRTITHIKPVDRAIDKHSWNSLLVDEKRYHHHRLMQKKTSPLATFSSLYFMNPGWSAKEETILIQHVLRHGLDQWHQVAQHGLRGKFTAGECRTCWKNLDMPVVSTLKGCSGSRSSANDEASLTIDGPILTKEQQGQFWALWRFHGSDWSSISSHMDSVSPEGCQAYFTTMTEHFSGSKQSIQEKILKLASASIPIQDQDPSGANSPAGKSLKPSRKAFSWSKERSVRLQAIVHQSYKSRSVHIDEINWPWVAGRLHPDATSRICKMHWKFLHEGQQATGHHDDLKKLEEGIRLLGPNKLPAVRDLFLPHMSKLDVTRLWYRLSDKATQVTEEEYYALHQAVQVHGTKLWTPVAAEMLLVSPGWKKMPCKRLWESSYRYLLGSETETETETESGTRGWTANADSALLRLVKLVGRDDWFSVAKALQNNRSAWQCRLRWCQLLDPVQLEKEQLTINGQEYD